MRRDNVSDPTIVKEPLAEDCAWVSPENKESEHRKSMSEDLSAFIGFSISVKNQRKTRPLSQFTLNYELGVVGQCHVFDNRKAKSSSTGLLTTTLIDPIKSLGQSRI